MGIRTKDKITSQALLGVVKSVDLEAKKAVVKSGELITPPLPWVVWGTKMWWAPKEGEQVVVLVPEGNINRGVIIGCVFDTNHPTGGVPTSGVMVLGEEETRLKKTSIQGGLRVITVDGDNLVDVRRNAITLKLGGGEVKVTSSGVALKGIATLNGKPIMTVGGGV